MASERLCHWLGHLFLAPSGGGTPPLQPPSELVIELPEGLEADLYVLVGGGESRGGTPGTRLVLKLKAKGGG